jgi:hypothetical protein
VGEICGTAQVTGGGCAVASNGSKHDTDSNGLGLAFVLVGLVSLARRRRRVHAHL